MKIAFLLSKVEGDRGVFHSTVRTASALSGRHQVEVWTVRGPHDDISVKVPADVRYLSLDADADTDADVAGEEEHALDDVEDERLRALDSQPSRLVPGRWERGFTALSDVLVERALRESTADVLVSTSAGTLAAAVSWRRPGTLVVHHERYRTLERRRVVEALRIFGPRVNGIVVGSEAVARQLRARLGRAAPPVSVLADPLPPGPLPLTGGDSRVVIAAGSLSPEGHFEHLVRAFGLVAGELADWRLRVFGTGPAKHRILATARKLQLFDRVEFPGISGDMPAEWARAGIAVVTSSSGTPLVAAEAMAAGLPVVAHNHPGGAAELIDHGRHGLLVDPSSPQGVAAALVELAGDRELRTKLGAAAVDAVSARAPHLVAGAWDHLLDEISDAPAAEGHLEPPGATSPAGSAHPPEPEVVAPSEARRSVLRLLADTAAAVSAEWWVMPPIQERPPVVVVPAEARQALLSRLVEDEVASGMVLEVLDAGGGTNQLRPQGPVGPLRTFGGDLVRAQPSVVSISWPRHWGGRATLARHDCQVDVEFWDAVGPDLAPVRRNEWVRRWRRGSALEEIEVCGLALPAIPLTATPTAYDVTFPVDAVYTWVDGDDPAWQRKRDTRLAETAGLSLTAASSGRARFVNRDELRYSMRSLHLFAPWLRHIYVVTDGQVPAWLDTSHPDVTMVTHEQILPAETLPTFNSHAIETGLHRIPGLSEHFIYFNDDVLLGRPVPPERFFTAAGQFAAFFGGEIIGEDAPDALPYRRAALNNRRLLERDFGLAITRTLLHTPHPFTRQVLVGIEERYAASVAATRAAAFRAETDISVASSLAQHLGLLTGTAYPGKVGARFIALTDANVEAVLDDTLAKRVPEVVCLGDHHDWAVPEAVVNQRVRGFLRSYFPLAAPWERQPDL